MQDLFTGESAIFADSLTARLFAPARSIERVYNAVTGEEFEANRDYIWEAGSDVITRTENSRIALLDKSELYPQEAIYYPAPQANAVPNGESENLRFDAKLFFAEHQFEVDYTPIDNSLMPVRAVENKTAKFKRMVTLGDSITEGYNASAYIGKAPFRKPYAGLVAEAVGAELLNLGLNGVSSSYWENVKDKAVAYNPDLITIAYGMNDLLGMSAAQYVEVIARAAEYFRKNSPQAKIVLVSAMSGHPQWGCTPTDKSEAFAAELGDYAQSNGFVFADVYNTWKTVLDRKGFFALTGNGVNHPNDYGHRLYAATILNKL